MPKDITSIGPDHKTLDSLLQYWRAGRKLPFTVYGDTGDIDEDTKRQTTAMTALLPHPSKFQPDVPVIGEPSFARSARQLLDADPYVKERVKKVIVGPDASTMRLMLQSGLQPDQFVGTTLLGAYHPKNGIAINPDPNMDNDAKMEVLAHELSHAAGYGEEGARKGADIFTGVRREKLKR